MKHITNLNNIGVDGLLCQYDGDQGDTCQREGLYISLLSLSGDHFLACERFDYSIQYLQVSPGVYRRASDTRRWYSNPNNLSRDQRGMLELSMAITNNVKTLKESALYILKRFGLHQNVHPGTDAPDDMRKIPDIASPGELAVYIRGLDIKLLYPLLYLLDIGLCIDAFTRSKWDGANMAAINIIYANKKFPTLISKLAAKIAPWNEFKKEITNYYSVQKNGIPELGELYVKVIDKFISNP